MNGKQTHQTGGQNNVTDLISEIAQRFCYFVNVCIGNRLQPWQDLIILQTEMCVLQMGFKPMYLGRKIQFTNYSPSYKQQNNNQGTK